MQQKNIKPKIDLNMNIQYIKGVGPARAEKLAKMNIYTVKELIEHFPRSYEDRTVIKKISEFVDQENVLFIARIVGKLNTQYVRKNLTISKVIVTDDSADCILTWFNQNYLKKLIQPDDTYLFYGKVALEYGRFVIDNPQIFKITDLDKIKGIYPIYTLTDGITQNYLFKIMVYIFSNYSIEYDEIFTDDFRKKYMLCDIDYAIQNIHFPKTFAIVDQVRNRIIFQELFLLQLALMSVKNNTKLMPKTTVFKDIDISEFLKILPFELTNAQKTVVSEIQKDLISSKVMNRLIQGDVGSGKTVVAAIAIYLAVKNGYQASMMAPTTILANQHFEEFKKYFSHFNMTVELITSNNTKKQKEKIVERLKNGQINILIGTHSLIEENIEFKNLGLVVTDEQHRFGVEQRVKLENKGKSVETLVMTATPIPRTLALMLYADLDLSVIDELPPGRKKILTYAVDRSFEARVNNFVKKNINQGRQAYVVCPLVEDNDELNLKSVKALYEKYKNEEFIGYTVEYMHGKMKNKEKDQIMQDFKENKINILISTTVIEVGVNVPNANIMIIEDADRFGLATLHQLRGRVGRGNYQSYCILKSSNKSYQAMSRLKIMEKSSSGFEIAQKDLELRGPGDFFGIRQHGLPEFKLANLLKDMVILKNAGQAAKDIIKFDKNLEKPENQLIKKAMFENYGNQLTNIGT